MADPAVFLERKGPPGNRLTEWIPVGRNPGGTENGMEQRRRENQVRILAAASSEIRAGPPRISLPLVPDCLA